MKYLTLVSLVIFVFVISSCSKPKYPAKQTKLKKLTPMEVLQSVKERYHSQNMLEVKGSGSIRVKANIMGTKQQKTRNFSFYFASEPPGKIRLETHTPKGGGITVSNDNNVWHYKFSLNEFTKKHYAILQTDIDHLYKELKSGHIKSGIAKNFARAFNPLTGSIKNIIKMTPDTIMMPDSSRRKVLKIKVRYAANKKDLNKKLQKVVKVPTFSIKSAKRSPTTFWIDPDIPVVLRESYGVSLKMVNKADSKKLITIDTKRDIYYTSVNLHPNFADSTFAFNPPKSAKKVKNLKKELKKTQHQKNKKGMLW